MVAIDIFPTGFMKKAIGTNIKLARVQKKLSQGELSEKCGWGPYAGRVSNYERGSREPKSEELGKIARALDVSLEWFYQDRTNSGTLAVRDNLATYKSIRYLPLLTLDQAVPYLKGQATKALDTFPIYQIDSDKGFVFMVEGDTMESPYGDTFPRKSIVGIDPSLEAESGDFVVALTDHIPTFKQLIIDSGRRYLKPLNDRYPTVEMKADSPILGVARIALRILR